MFDHTFGVLVCTSSSSFIDDHSVPSPSIPGGIIIWKAPKSVLRLSIARIQFGRFHRVGRIIGRGTSPYPTTGRAATSVSHQPAVTPSAVHLHGLGHCFHWCAFLAKFLQRKVSLFPSFSPHCTCHSVGFLLVVPGSLFELLSGGNGSPPPLGVPATAAIVVVGLPLSLFLFYASILKATAETEEDDKQFLGKS